MKDDDFVFFRTNAEEERRLAYEQAKAERPELEPPEMLYVLNRKVLIDAIGQLEVVVVAPVSEPVTPDRAAAIAVVAGPMAGKILADSMADAILALLPSAPTPPGICMAQMLQGKNNIRTLCIEDECEWETTTGSQGEGAQEWIRHTLDDHDINRSAYASEAL